MEASDEPGHVVLSPRAFAVCWWFLVSYHLFNALFAALLAFSHLIIGTPTVFRHIWMLAISQRTLVVAGWSYAVVAVLQVLIVVRHIIQSLRAQRLSLGFDDTFASKHQCCSSVSSFAQKLKSMWLDGKARTFGATEAEAAFELRQLLEIVLQTYQADQLSRSVARPELQAFVVSVIVVNCIHTPLLDMFWAWQRRRQQGTQPSTLEHSHQARVVLLHAIDVWLDFAVAVVLPICLLVPRLMEFDYPMGRFPRRFTYSDVWNTMAINEGRQVLVTSSVDYVSSILPHLLGMVSLRFIKSKLRCRSSQVVPEAESNKDISNISETVRPPTKVAGPTQATAQAASCQQRPKKALTKAIRWIGCGWAVLVISLHIHAQHWNYSEIKGCLVVFPAWFASHAPCAALRFNCYTRGEIAGSSQEIHDTLTVVERSVLRFIIFTHCPALEMPPIVVREFANINAIGMFNCTIHKWDINSAITHSYTPTLALLQLVDTNMTSLPDGFAHAEMPPVLSLNLYGSNLSSLPNTIGETWGKVSWSTLWLEYTQLTTLPESFSEVHATKLSLEGSPVTHLPEKLFQQHAFPLVRLSKTQLVELPPVMDDTSQLTIFLAEDTNIADVPEWLRLWASAVGSDHTVSLRGSPACELKPETNAQLCLVVDPIKRNALPYDIIAAQRPLDGL